MEILGNAVGGVVPIKTLIIKDENGTELVGAVVGEETVLTATDNDVREGSVYAGDAGVSTGTKNIPNYHTSEGKKFIQSGETYEIKLTDTLYDFTKFQAIICPYNGSIAQSVAAEKVAIDDGVYAVNSTELLAYITKNDETESINLGITNQSETMYVLRYFTYKEIY